MIAGRSQPAPAWNLAGSSQGYGDTFRRVPFALPAIETALAASLHTQGPDMIAGVQL